MTALALTFMIASWSFVLGLAGWCLHRVLRAGRDRDRAQNRESGEVR